MAKINFVVAYLCKYAVDLKFCLNMVIMFMCKCQKCTDTQKCP